MSKEILFKLMGFTLVLFLVLAGCSSEPSSEPNSEPSSKPSADSSSGSEEVFILKAGQVGPPTHSYQIGLENFAKDLEEATNGKVKIEIFGGGQLGGERDMTEQVSLGTLDMAVITSGVVGNFVPNLGALEMPFIFRDLEHVYKTLDSEIGDELLAQMENSGIKGLGLWENGYRNFTNNKKEIISPDDMKGLKMRTIENEVFVDTYKALGADPTPIAWPEVYTSIQQGVVDGMDNSLGVIASTKGYEVQSFLSETGIYYASAVLMMSKEKFDALPNDIQEIIIKLGKEHAVKQRALNQEMESAQRQELIDNGVKITPVEDLDMDAFKAAVQSVYEKNANNFGGYIERIKEVK